MANIDCQELGTLDKKLDCAANLKIDVYTTWTDTPPIVASSVLPTGLQSLLSDCSGNDSCKLVSFDFTGDSGLIASKAEYVVNTENNEAADRGVFFKDGTPPPPVMREPPGFDFSSAIDPTRATQIGSASIGASSEVCARVCEDDSTCKAFNYEPLSSRCEYFSAFTEESYGDPTFQKIGFVRQDIPIKAGKKYPGIPDSPVTYLDNTGVDCEDMPKCNSNIEALVNSGTTVGFSTDDLDACGYCPLKTFRFKDDSYIVQGELGETKVFTDKAQALDAIKLKQSGPNPNTVISALQQNFIYTLNPFVKDVASTDDTFRTRNPGKETMCENGDFRFFLVQGVNIGDLEDAIKKLEWTKVTSIVGPTYANLIQKGASARMKLAEFYYRDPTWVAANPGYQTEEYHKMIVAESMFTSPDIVSGQLYFGSVIWNKILGSWRFLMNNDWNGVTNVLGETDAQALRDSVLSSDSLPMDVLYADSRFYRLEVVGRKMIFKTLTQTLSPIWEGESSNTWEVESVDYVTDGIRIKNIESQKYVTSTLFRTLVAWGDKYTSDFNNTVFIASNPISFDGFLRQNYTMPVMFQSNDGTKRTTYDGTTFKALKNIFSVFKLTFDQACAPAVPTICAQPSVVQASGKLACPGKGTFRAGTGNSKCNGNASNTPTTAGGLLCYFSCESGYSPVGGWSESVPYGCSTTKSCIADSYTAYSCPVGFTLEGQTCRPTADSGCSSSLTGSCSSQVPTLLTSSCTTENANWSVIDTPNNFQVYGVTDDTVNVNDPPATYQALYNLNGSSTVYPSNSTKSLRRWVQEDYVYKNFAPGVVDVSISVIGSMYVDVKSWDDASMCIFSKVGTINTRYPNAVTNTGATERNLIGYGATTLTSKRTACVTELGSFYTSLTPWNNVENVKTMYSDSAAVRLLAIKNYLIFMTKAIDAFKIGMNKVMEDLLRYMSETTAINDAQLTQVNTAYMFIRDKKADIDTAVVSRDVTNIIANWSRLTTTTSASATSAPLPSGWSAMSVQSQQYLDDIGLQSLIDETYTLLKSVKDLVMQNYNDYNDSYTKLQDIKGYSTSVETTSLVVPIRKALDDKRVSITMGYYEQVKVDTVSPSLQVVRDEFKNQMDRIMSVGIFAACAVGTFRALASDPVCASCTTCASGTYVSTACTETQNRACTPCTAGTDFSTIPNAGSCTPCADCVAGTKVNASCTVTSDRTCTPCVTGSTFSTGTNASTCQPCATCAAGTYVSTACTTTINRVCTNCAAGYYSAIPNATECTQCVTGSTSIAGSSTCTCTGTLQNGYLEWSVANICTKKCNTGYTLSAAGTCDLTSCTLAGGKDYAATTGTLSYADTTYGTVSRTDTVTQVTLAPCSKPSPEPSTTLTLPDRSVTATTSTTSVIVGSTVTYTTPQGAYCPAGKTYTSPPARGGAYGIPSCVSCPAGTYSGTAGKQGTTATQCSTCADGTYSSAGASSCSTCTAACTGSTYESTSCTTTSNRVCSPCTSCTNPTNGTASVTGCSGTSGPGTCSYSCNPGYFYTSGTQVVGPSSSSSSGISGVTVGAGSSGGGGSSPAKAGWGPIRWKISRYVTSLPDTPTCTPCAAGKYSAAGATSCTNCAAGTYSAAGASSCTNCTAGTYSAAGASSCSSCAAGTYSAAGATSCTNCSTTCGAGKYISSACTTTADIGCTSCSTTCSASGALIASCAGTETSNPACYCPANTKSEVYEDGATQSVKTACLCKPGYATASGVGSSCTACGYGTYSANPFTAGLTAGYGHTVCSTCAACPANQTRVDCGGSNPGRCVNNCVYTWSTGACNKTCGGYQIVTPVITQYADGANPTQCPAPYAQSCSSTCTVYLYSGQAFNGNRRGYIDATASGQAVMETGNIKVRQWDLRSMNVPQGLTVVLWSETYQAGELGRYNGAWAGQTNPWDRARSISWYYTNPSVPVQVVAPTGKFCPTGTTMIGSGSTASCKTSNNAYNKPELRCPLNYVQDPLKTWCVRF